MVIAWPCYHHFLHLKTIHVHCMRSYPRSLSTHSVLSSWRILHVPPLQTKTTMPERTCEHEPCMYYECIIIHLAPDYSTCLASWRELVTHNHNAGHLSKQLPGLQSLAMWPAPDAMDSLISLAQGKHHTQHKPSSQCSAPGCMWDSDTDSMSDTMDSISEGGFSSSSLECVWSPRSATACGAAHHMVHESDSSTVNLHMELMAGSPNTSTFSSLHTTAANAMVGPSAMLPASAPPTQHHLPDLGCKVGAATYDLCTPCPWLTSLTGLRLVNLSTSALDPPRHLPALAATYRSLRSLSLAGPGCMGQGGPGGGGAAGGGWAGAGPSAMGLPLAAVRLTDLTGLRQLASLAVEGLSLQLQDLAALTQLKVGGGEGVGA